MPVAFKLGSSLHLRPHRGRRHLRLGVKALKGVSSSATFGLNDHFTPKLYGCIVPKLYADAWVMIYPPKNSQSYHKQLEVDIFALQVEAQAADLVAVELRHPPLRFLHFIFGWLCHHHHPHHYCTFVVTCVL